MEIYLTVIFGLFGAAVGSFINVCVDRLPAGKSLNYPPSHCDVCQKRLAVLDLFPVISYITLKGHCRYCHAKIPLRVLFVELGCGIFTAFLFWHQGLTLELAFTAFYSYIFIIIAIIDLRHKLILNKIVYPSLAASLIIAPFFIKQDVVGSGVVDQGIVNALIGGAVGFLFLLIPVIVTQGRGMGFGDVKYAALIGMATGFAEVLVAVLGGIILGAFVGVILLALGMKKGKDAIPFGSFLSLTAIITLLWGTDILDWYINLFLL
jgi:leader peptidase (prepilin peptidase)/N-methyltransferase